MGWCLDQMQIAMDGIPKDLPEEVNSRYSRVLRLTAKLVIIRVQGYLNTLIELVVENPTFKEDIRKLEQSTNKV